jgi:hypothetical protein
LDAVHAALELQAGPHPVGRRRLRADGDRRVLVAAQLGLGVVQHLRLPAVLLGVAQVHGQQVAREQSRLVAALAGLDLHDEVVAVVGVAGQEQLGELRLQRRDADLQGGGLLGERLVLRRQLAGRGQVVAGALQVAERADDGGQLRIAAAQLAGPCLVAVHGRVGERGLQLVVLAEQLTER